MSSMSVNPECESVVIKGEGAKVLKLRYPEVPMYLLFPICTHLIPCKRYNLHDSRKNRQRKPKYKYSCKKQCNRFDEFHHGTQCEIDFPLILDSDFLNDISDGRSLLSTLDHLEDICREEES